MAVLQLPSSEDEIVLSWLSCTVTVILHTPTMIYIKPLGFERPDYIKDVRMNSSPSVPNRTSQPQYNHVHLIISVNINEVGWIIDDFRQQLLPNLWVQCLPELKYVHSSFKNHLTDLSRSCMTEEQIAILQKVTATNNFYLGDTGGVELPLQKVAFCTTMMLHTTIMYVNLIFCCWSVY